MQKCPENGCAYRTNVSKQMQKHLRTTGHGSEPRKRQSNQHLAGAFKKKEKKART